MYFLKYPAHNSGHTHSDIYTDGAGAEAAGALTLAFN
ncbi:hypothetical protein T190611E02C_50161 [Tenacibaculum sp. 190524A05c]